MKLVYVVKRFPKVSETFVLNEIREVLRQGDDVTVCALRRPHPGDPVHPGAADVAGRVLYVPEGASRFLRLSVASLVSLAKSRATWGALRWSASWSVRERTLAHLKRFAEAAYLRQALPTVPDHIHAHFAHGPATVGVLLGRLYNRPFSFTGHAKDIYQLVRPELLAEKLGEARFAAAESESSRSYMARIARPADRSKVAVVRNGIDPGLFRPRLEEPPDGVGLTVSRLVEKKGLDTLIDACGLLAERGRDFRWEVIGEGPLRRRLGDRTEALHLRSRVALLGSRDQKQVRDAYGRARLFVLPCREMENGDRDCLPVAILEALAVGVPVISTPISGIPEVVRDGESGLLVPPNDPEALSAAIERVLSDHALRDRLVSGGREAVAAFDLKGCVAELRHLFREGPVADGDRRPPSLTPLATPPSTAPSRT
jgi:glycosyltransferase involved in cell wall biosynthesis